jgi:hypothetical protein
MAIKTDIKLTSVKIVKDLYNAFKHASLDDDNINLQKLVNRTLLFYVEDESFRKKINEQTNLEESGSSF